MCMWTLCLRASQKAIENEVRLERVNSLYSCCRWFVLVIVAPLHSLSLSYQFSHFENLVDAQANICGTYDEDK